MMGKPTSTEARPRLLIVEDDVPVAEALKWSTDEAGLEVMALADSEKGCRQACPQGLPNLALMDLHLKRGQ
jgi:ActR/RegA family two-component response regulator